MNLRTVILSFLAGRFPAAYTEAAVRGRVNASGLLEKPATLEEVQQTLGLLSNRLKAVCCEADPVSGDIYWNATQEGVRLWANEGRHYVA